MSTEVPIPLTEGQKSSADDTPDASRRCINYLIDPNDTIRPRPGIVNTDFAPGVYNRTTGSGVIGMYVWQSTFNNREYLVYVRNDRTIWAVDLVTTIETSLSTAGTLSTMLDGAATYATFAEDTQRLVIAGGGQLQIWTGDPAVQTTRIAATTIGVNQPPLSATHVLGIQNYLVANQAALPGTRGQIFWSNLGDGNHTVWNPLNFNTADADPDPIVALGQNLRQVFAFGTKTVQTFGPGADPFLPFAAASSIVLGCGAPYSPIPIDGGQYALLDNARRFVTTDGNSNEWISRDIDKLLRDLSTVADCYGFRCRIAYWDLLVWLFPTAQRGFAFDLARNTWFPVRGWNGVDDYAAIRIGAYAFWPNGNLHFTGDPKYPNIWTLNQDAQSDTAPGTPIVSDLVTERLDQGMTGRKRCERVRFFIKRGQSTATPATLDVQKRDDDGPWSASQQLNLGLQGDYRSFVDWFPGGVYHRRQYRIRYSGGVTTAIRKAVEFVEPHGG